MYNLPAITALILIDFLIIITGETPKSSCVKQFVAPSSLPAQLIALKQVILSFTLEFTCIQAEYLYYIKI